MNNAYLDTKSFSELVDLLANARALDQADTENLKEYMKANFGPTFDHQISLAHDRVDNSEMKSDAKIAQKQAINLVGDIIPRVQPHNVTSVKMVEAVVVERIKHFKEMITKISTR